MGGSTLDPKERELPNHRLPCQIGLADPWVTRAGELYPTGHRDFKDPHAPPQDGGVYRRDLDWLYGPHLA